MAANNKIITNLGADLMKFTFTDEDGDTFAYFRMNPADIKLYDRLRSVDKKVEAISAQYKDQESTGELTLELNNAIEDVFCYILGYDVRESLFGFMSATAILADGEPFYMRVLDIMTAAVGKEVEKRSKKMAKNIEKYTEKYANEPV